MLAPRAKQLTDDRLAHSTLWVVLTLYNDLLNTKLSSALADYVNPMISRLAGDFSSITHPPIEPCY